MQDIQETQELIPKIRIAEEYIYIHRSLIRLLGKPGYITLLENEAHQTVAIIPCDESHTMAFKVPEKHSDTKRDMRIWSKEYVQGLRSRYCLEPGVSYTLSGVYIAKHNAVVFRFPQYRSHGFIVYTNC